MRISDWSSDVCSSDLGAIAALAVGIVIMAPPLKMHAVTQFASGNGPVWAGGLFPFLFITIACGAVSGFHALISSGTTPKLIASEAHAPMIGYGAMLMEAFVAIMALEIGRASGRDRVCQYG